MFLFFEGFLLVRNIIILENNISTMLLWSVSYMPQWYITLNHTMALTAFSSGHSFVNKFLKEIYIYIYIYIYFHFSFFNFSASSSSEFAFSFYTNFSRIILIKFALI